jgi:hypothetical protein
MDRGIDMVTSRLLRQSNQIGVDFLLADLETGHTFLDIADLTEAAETHSRNHERAREVYFTVLRLLPRVAPDPDEKDRLQQRLAQLRKRLEDAGYLSESEISL